MGRGRLPKCRYCQELISDKTQATKKGNYWYHNLCLEKYVEEKESKMTDYDKLVDYIYKLYNGNVPVFVFKQIKDYKNDYGMKYSGILLTLKYIYEDLQMKFDESNGIGMVVYKYDECSNNWKKEQEIKKAIEEFEFNDKEVVVNKRFDNNRKMKYKPIDMEEL